MPSQGCHGNVGGRVFLINSDQSRLGYGRMRFEERLACIAGIQTQRTGRCAQQKVSVHASSSPKDSSRCIAHIPKKVHPSAPPPQRPPIKKTRRVRGPDFGVCLPLPEAVHARQLRLAGDAGGILALVHGDLRPGARAPRKKNPQAQAAHFPPKAAAAPTASRQAPRVGKTHGLKWKTGVGSKAKSEVI